METSAFLLPGFLRINKHSTATSAAQLQCMTFIQTAAHVQVYITLVFTRLTSNYINKALRQKQKQKKTRSTTDVSNEKVHPFHQSDHVGHSSQKHPRGKNLLIFVLNKIETLSHILKTDNTKQVKAKVLAFRVLVHATHNACSVPGKRTTELDLSSWKLYARSL